MSVMRLPRLDENALGWRDQASCRHVDTNLFFPAGTTGDAQGQVEAAKAVCRSCPVQVACLEFAIATGQDDGIWGGKDEAERRRLRRVWRRGKRESGSAIGQSRRVAGPATRSEVLTDRRQDHEFSLSANVDRT